LSHKTTADLRLHYFSSLRFCPHTFETVSRWARCRNEKTGIPLEFLQVLDVCVEIPQCGLIRSLNVHVTGAIFVWEYHKQWTSQLTTE